MLKRSAPLSQGEKGVPDTLRDKTSSALLPAIADDQRRFFMRRFRKLPALLLAAALPVLSACVVTRMYHDQYGLETANPGIFNRDRAACLERAYKAFPFQNAPAGNNVNLYFAPPPPPGTFAYWEYERRMREYEERQDQLMDAVSRYEEARDTVYRACMGEKGWYEIQVEQ